MKKSSKVFSMDNTLMPPSKEWKILSTRKQYGWILKLTQEKIDAIRAHASEWHHPPSPDTPLHLLASDIWRVVSGGEFTGEYVQIFALESAMTATIREKFPVEKRWIEIIELIRNKRVQVDYLVHIDYTLHIDKK